MKLVKVSLASESDRYKSVFKSLDLVFSDIKHHLYSLNPNKDYIVIKPNCIDTKNQLAVTNVDAIKAVLDFIEPVWQGRVIIAEGSGLGNTMEAFKKFNYMPLGDIYPNVTFLDMNYSEHIFTTGFDKNLAPLQIKISNTLAQAPLRISIGPPKTHDNVIVTLSIKNMAVGAILKSDKENIHQGYKAINKTIAALNQYTYPHISVIDGWVGMEGDGPIYGSPKETHFAVASTNCLGADVITTKIMGFNPIQVGYLNILGAQNIINLLQIIGCDINKFNFSFKHPKNYLDQINWY